MTSIFKNLKNVKNKFRNQKSELAKNRRPTDKSLSGDPRTLTMFVKSRGVRWSCHSRKHTGQQSIKKANQFSKKTSDGTHKIFYVKARKTILLNEELTEMFLFCFEPSDDGKSDISSKFLNGTPLLAAVKIYHVNGLIQDQWWSGISWKKVSGWDWCMFWWLRKFGKR